MPWKLHRKTGCSNETSRILDKPPVELIGHRQWRTLTHNPFGLLVLKAMWGDRFKLGEAVSHVLVDDLLPYKQRKLLARLLKSR